MANQNSERVRLALALAVAMVILAAAGVAIFMPVNPLRQPIAQWTIFGVVAVGLGILGLLELRPRHRSRLVKHFTSFGKGYGLVEGLRHATEQIDAIRDRHARGELSDDEALVEEERVLLRLAAFYGDKRWREVMRKKRAHEERGAQELAKALRREYRL